MIPGHGQFPTETHFSGESNEAFSDLDLRHHRLCPVFAIFLYSIAFIGNFGVPNSLDSEPRSPVWMALTINMMLLGMFAVQHSLMARPFFKRWLTRFIPESMERSTYVFASNFAMIAVFAGWQPMGFAVWNVTHPIFSSLIDAFYFLGWMVLFSSTLMLNHFDLFGLRQVWLQFTGKPYTQLEFKTPGFYKYVRHPLYVGWLMIFWFAPVMTASHLLFAGVTTVYILVAIVLEERDLERSLGMDYTRYRNEVPKLIPRFTRRRPQPVESVTQPVQIDSGIQQV